MRPYHHDAICKITHTEYSHHWYIRTRLQCGHIFMTRYAKSHTHWSCSQVVDIAARGHWISFISVDGLENWFLACNETTKLSEPALLVCKSILLVEGESIGKIMIMGYKMKDCSSWKQWSMDTWWNCSSWCQEVLGYLPLTQLRARGMSQGFFWQLCSRDEQHNHRLSQKFF
jgi:hypothetical protein